MKKTLLLFSFTGLLILSCENTLSPLDNDIGLYSVFGVLQLGKDTNYIRVRDLKAPFTLEATREIDAEVTLENVDANTSEKLVHEKFQQEGIFHHNYVVQNVLPDTEYRLRIERSDGRSMELSTKTPSIPTVSISPDNRSCRSEVAIEFENVNGGRLEYVLEKTPVRKNPLKNLNFFEVFYISLRKLLIPVENNPEQALSFKVIPANAGRFFPEVENCKELGTDKFFATYIYYSKGLQEELIPEDFEVVERVIRFGSIYVDSLEISFDTTSTLEKSLR